MSTASLSTRQALVVAIVDDPRPAEREMQAADAAKAALLDRVAELETLLELAKKGVWDMDTRLAKVSSAVDQAEHMREILDNLLDSNDVRPCFPMPNVVFTFGGPHVPALEPARITVHITIRDILNRRGNFARAQEELRAVPDRLFCPEHPLVYREMRTGYLKMLLLLQSLDIETGTAVKT
jgi:hypothetical protein